MKRPFVVAIVAIALVIGTAVFVQRTWGSKDFGVGTTAGTPAATPRGTLPPPITLPDRVNDVANVDRAGDAAVFSMDVSANNFYFDPTFIRAKPGARIEIRAHNRGSLSHTFTVDAQQIDIVMAKGQDGAATVTVPTSGFVSFYCRFHRGGGMRGAIYVQ